jgi:hypothetical protein
MAAMASSVAANGMNNPDAMFDLASTAGKSFLASSSARMIPGLEAVMMNLRGYFAVDNRYVKSKMGRILFPFMTKSWKRLVSRKCQHSSCIDLMLVDSQQVPFVRSNLIHKDLK